MLNLSSDEMEALVEHRENAYANDAVIKLTKEGVDLAEGTIEDNGVDI